jgi:two-component system response regulator
MDELTLQSKFRVLVVDDNPADVELLRRALADAKVNCQLTVIDDGADAIALVRMPRQGDSNVPHLDLAIIDLNLPKHGGLEVVEKMRANPSFAELPVIILSSSPSTREHATLERLRVRQAIVKPPDLDEFMRIGERVRDVLLEGHAKG